MDNYMTQAIIPCVLLTELMYAVTIYSYILKRKIWQRLGLTCLVDGELYDTSYYPLCVANRAYVCSHYLKQ